MKTKVQQWHIHLVLLIATFFHAGNYIAAKWLMPDPFHPFAVILWRVAVAGALFWITGLFSGFEKVERQDYLKILVCAIFGVSANILLFFKGLSLSSPLHASLINTTTPILVLIISAIVLKERITSLKVTGVILGITGAALLLTGTKDVAENPQVMTGDIIIWINALFYGIYLVRVKPLMYKYRPMTVFQWVFVAGVLIDLPFGIYGWQQSSMTAITPMAWAALAYIAVPATFFTYLMNAWSLKYVNASVVGSYIYLQPLLASVLAIWIGQDTLSWQKAIYALLIFSGVYLVSKAPSVNSR